MSESEKDNKLLGKKRDPESVSEEENDNNLSKKNKKHLKINLKTN